MARKYIYQQSDDFSITLGLGLIESMDPVSVIGLSVPIPADVETDISLLNALEILLPNNLGTTIQLWSTDGGDDQEIKVQGLGANGVLIEPQVITLNGTTPVDLPVDMSRINFGENISLTPCVGTINIGLFPSVVFSNILPENQVAKQALYSIPVGYTLVVQTLIASLKRLAPGNADIAATISTKFKSFNQSFFYRGIPFDLVRSGSSSAQFSDPFPSPIIGPADVKLTATVNIVDTEVIGRFNGVLAKTS